MLTIVRLNAIVQKYNLTAANYGYVIRYNMYAPTTTVARKRLSPASQKVRVKKIIGTCPKLRL